MSEDDELPMELEIPPSALSTEALRGVIEEFVTREGTEYGHSDVSLADKVAEVRRQLERGDVVLTFDRRTETANLLSRRDWGRRG
jgi:uncharacterized protein